MRTADTLTQLLNQHRPALQERFSVRRIGLLAPLFKGWPALKATWMCSSSSIARRLITTWSRSSSLKNLFHSPVDLVLADTLKPRIKSRVLAETVYA